MKSDCHEILETSISKFHHGVATLYFVFNAITVKLKANAHELVLCLRESFYGFYCEDVKRVVLTSKRKLKQLKKE